MLLDDKQLTFASNKHCQKKTRFSGNRKTAMIVHSDKQEINLQITIYQWRGRWEYTIVIVLHYIHCDISKQRCNKGHVTYYDQNENTYLWWQWLDTVGNA